MALRNETVAIPVVKGINVNTPARLLEASELLEATNVRFPAGAGAKKRRGHSGQRVRGAKAIPPDWTPPAFSTPLRVPTFSTEDRSLPEDWLFGYGYFTDDSTVDPTIALDTSEYPEDGLAFGATARDNEALIWSGHRLFSKTNLDIPGGKFTEVNAVMPALRSEPIAKANIAQGNPDCADNGIIRVTTWLNDGDAYYSVTDSTSGASIVSSAPLAGLGTVTAVRCVPVGAWVHMFCVDSDADQLALRSIHQDSPDSVQHQGLGDCNGPFDVWKQSESLFLVAKATATEIRVRVHTLDGSITENWVASIGSPTLIASVAICADPVSSYIGLVWLADSTVKARVFDDDGTTQGAILTLGTTNTAARAVAVAPKYLESSDEAVFNAYWDDVTVQASVTVIHRFRAGASGLYTASRYHHLLGSQGFRVGERTFIWAAANSTYQSKWVLLDEALLPVGHAEYITAKTPDSDSTPSLFSVNWWGEAPAKDRVVYHNALSYRVRVAVEPTQVGVDPPPVYSEPAIKFAQLDFLPPLRSAQAGRCTYFAGAQLWTYDGTELTEAQFHYAPEDVQVAAAAGGELTADGQYIYRVDLCYRNAQNEEIRSASFYTSELTLTGANQSATLTINTCLTRRENSYFLIFRNESAGTFWYLCNSRDPSSALFLRNDLSVTRVTYTDSTVSDAELNSREQHPNQSFEYLDPFVSPACEVIAYGRKRLWVAGGEIASGSLYPSRLFDIGQTPAFHGDLALEVDRGAESITAIGFVEQFAVFFRKSDIWAEDEFGPDNIQQGDWNDPRQLVPDIGAVSQDSVAKIKEGLVFQSQAGIRLMTPGGGIIPIGQPVDAEAKEARITAAVVSGPDQEVRFYCWDSEALVFNYQYNTWSKWTVPAAGAIRNADTGLAIVAAPTGVLLTEEQGTWTDNSQPFKMRVRFAWLRAGSLLDFQRVRRIGACGEGEEHDIHVDVYYNEREFAEEWFDWEIPDESQNQDTFGNEDFGDGNFGDTEGLSEIQFRDSVWPWRRRLARQKCSVISIAIDDNSTNGEGFTLTALALELAKKKGLDRSPWRGGTYSNTGASGSSETGE